MNVLEWQTTDFNDMIYPLNKEKLPWPEKMPKRIVEYGAPWWGDEGFYIEQVISVFLVLDKLQITINVHFESKFLSESLALHISVTQVNCKSEAILTLSMSA